MRLDDQLKREGRMLYLGGENAGVPESHYAQIPWDNLAARVLENERKRLEASRVRLHAKRQTDAPKIQR